MGGAARRLVSTLWRLRHRWTPFRERQVWRFEHAADPEARLVIYRIAPDPECGRIYYVVPFTTWIPQLTATQEQHAVFPMSERALRRSITRLLRESSTPINVDGEVDYWDSEWRAERVGLFDPHALGFWLEVYLELHKRSPENHPAACSSAAEPSAAGDVRPGIAPE